VARKAVKPLLFLVALLVLPGCFSSTFQSSGILEERAAMKARKAFYSELKKAVAEADSILVFSIERDPKKGLVLSPKKTYRKGEPGFEILTEGFLKASKVGVVARTPADRKIVLLSKGKKIYQFEHCTADRRIESEKMVNGKCGILFVSQKASKLLL
jgi:hypothetical protein